MTRRDDWGRKNMSVLREGDSAWEQRKKVRGNIKDYSMKHIVELAWDINDETIRDRIFRLKIDNVEVLLDAEEIQRLIRFV